MTSAPDPLSIQIARLRDLADHGIIASAHRAILREIVDELARPSVPQDAETDDRGIDTVVADGLTIREWAEKFGQLSDRLLAIHKASEDLDAIRQELHLLYSEVSPHLKAARPSAGSPPTCYPSDKAALSGQSALGIAPAAQPEPVVIAERIAREAHAGQREELTGDPYIRHVERIVAMVDGDDAKVVAWLHDVVEDNPTWTFDRLEQEGIPRRLIRPVSMLTRRQPYTYADYIDDIATAGEPLAVTIKIADLRDHLRPNCPPARRERYEKALAKLSALPAAVPAPPHEEK